MDEAGIETADIVGNSLGGFIALQLAARGRARSVVALAPAGGWSERDSGLDGELVEHFAGMHDLARAAAPHADAIAATEEGRRQATQLIATNFEHIPADLIAHQIRGVAGCVGLPEMLDFAGRETKGCAKVRRQAARRSTARKAMARRAAIRSAARGVR